MTTILSTTIPTTTMPPELTARAGLALSLSGDTYSYSCSYSKVCGTKQAKYGTLVSYVSYVIRKVKIDRVTLVVPNLDLS